MSSVIMETLTSVAVPVHFQEVQSSPEQQKT